jgi:death-on-curing protein
MRYLTLGEVVELHRAVIEETGGRAGIRALGALDSALAQQGATFDGLDLHPSLVDKSAALCFSLVRNHPFLDGNKRVGHAAMETSLVLNGSEIEASIDEQERLMLDIAAGHVNRNEVAAWRRGHVRSLS